LPFKGRTIKTVIQAVLRDTPVAPRSLHPRVPPYLSRLIMDLLEKSPEDRPRSARMLIAALDEAEQRLDEVPHEPQAAPAASPDDPDDESDSKQDQTSERRSRPRKSRVPKPPKPRKARRKGQSDYTLEGRVIWWSIFAGVCVFLLLAALVIRNLFFRRDESSGQRPPVPIIAPVGRIVRV
ncbi:MAG: hypothetical protein SNJ82_01565, partial [Gemmataceae bacterium]